MTKQKLLATTALVALFAGSAFADGGPAVANDLSVKIGGMFDGYAIAKADNPKTTSITKNNSFIGFATNAWVWLEAMNTTAKGLEYGAHIGLTTHAKSARNPANASTSLDSSWLWLSKDNLGRVEFGSNDDASASMRVGGDSVAVASGGISGNWFQAVLGSNFFRSGETLSADNFLWTPWSMGDNALNTNLASADDVTYLEKARKVTYYSPKWNGFQGGFSYTPDSQNLGNTANIPNTTANAHNAGLSDTYSGGITWDGQVMNDITAGASVIGMWGSAKNGYNGSNVVKTAYTEGFDVGGMLMYKELKGALSYGYMNRTGYVSSGKHTSDIMYATAGLGYNWDKLHTSATYFYGHKNDNNTHVASFGAEYALASGIMPYAETTYYNLGLRHQGGLSTAVATTNVRDANRDSEPVAHARSTNGVVFIIGTKLKF